MNTGVRRGWLPVAQLGGKGSQARCRGFESLRPLARSARHDPGGFRRRPGRDAGDHRRTLRRIGDRVERSAPADRVRRSSGVLTAGDDRHRPRCGQRRAAPGGQRAHPAVVGGLFALRVRARRPLVATQLVVLPAGLMLIALAVPPSLPLLAAVAVWMASDSPLGDPLWLTTLQRNVGERRYLTDRSGSVASARGPGERRSCTTSAVAWSTCSVVCVIPNRPESTASRSRRR
jgi:hypothetical protein